MSLTAELRSPTSPLRHYFAVRLGNVAPILDTWPTRQAKPAVRRPRAANYPAATVGTAFDYRLRYGFEATPAHRLVAHAGAALLPAHVRPVVQDFFDGLDDLVARVAPTRHPLEPGTEQALAGRCHLLALMEALYRSGQHAWAESPLRDLPGTPLLDLVPEACAQDVAALWRAFHERHEALLDQPAVCNPTFAGSPDVYGADADLIVGSCLIDVKTVARADVLPVEWLWQLVGYVLLDYDDVHRIDATGIYLSRHAELVRWDLDSLVHTLTSGAAQIPLLRAELRDLLARARPSG